MYASDVGFIEGEVVFDNDEYWKCNKSFVRGRSHVIHILFYRSSVVLRKKAT